MWEDILLLVLVQAGSLLIGWFAGYWTGRYHKLVGLMDNDEFVKPVQHL